MNDLFFSILAAKLFNYADDNTINAIAETSDEVRQILTDDTERALKWFDSNLMKANPEKFQFIVSHKHNRPQSSPLQVLDVEIHVSPFVNLLGVLLDEKLCFNDHVDSVLRKTSRQVNALCRFGRDLNVERKLILLKSFILCNFTYCSAVWHFCGKTNTDRLERILKRALRFVFRDYASSYVTLLERAGLVTLEEGRLYAFIVEMFKSRNGLAPSFLWDSFNNKSTPYELRRVSMLEVPRKRSTKHGLHSFSFVGPKLWNAIPNDIKNSKTVSIFKQKLKTINLTMLIHTSH